MKKILCVLMCVLILFSFAACNNNNDDEKRNDDPYNINKMDQTYEDLPDGELHVLKEPHLFFEGIFVGEAKESDFLKKKPGLEPTETTLGNNIPATTYVEVCTDNKYVQRICTYSFVDGILAMATDFSTLKAVEGNFTQETVYDNFRKSLDVYVKRISHDFWLDEVEFEGSYPTEKPGMIGSWMYMDNRYIQIVAYPDMENHFGVINFTHADISILQ